MRMPVSKPVWLLSVSNDTTMLWPSFDLRYNETLKSSRLSIPASEVSSLITMFLSEQPYFYAALANKGPAFFTSSSHLLWPISQQNLVLFRMVAKKNLHFSFISVFFLFFLMPLVTCWTHDSALSTPFLPLSQFVPPLPTFLCSFLFMLFGLWTQWI